MDPNETLKILRELSAYALAPEPWDDSIDAGETAIQLAEHFQALDEWIQRGGFLPAGWVIA